PGQASVVILTIVIPANAGMTATRSLVLNVSVGTLESWHAPGKASRRPVRDVPGRSVPTHHRICCNPPSGEGWLPGRGAACADLLWATRLQLRPALDRLRPRAKYPGRLWRLRLRGRALRLLRRHAEAAPAASIRRGPEPAGQGCRPGRSNVRVGQFSDRCDGRAATGGKLCGRPGYLPRQLLRPAGIRHQGAAASSPAGDGGRSGRNGGSGDLLRLWRHVLREVSRHFGAHGVRQDP